MRTKTFGQRLAGIVLLVFACCAGLARAEASGEAVLENEAIRVVAVPGQSGVAVYVRSDVANKRMELAIVGKGAGHGEAVSEARVVESESGRILHVTAGSAGAELSLGLNGLVKISPGTNAASVEIRCGARFAVLPDFFADDVVFDPMNLAMPALTIPAENFLLQFVEGGNTIVMCDWPGRLKQTRSTPSTPSTGSGQASSGPARRQGTAIPAGTEEQQGAEPQVDLIFAGEGAARRVAAARIEFQGQPVYAGILERKGIWHDQDATALPTYKPTTIDWKRPFAAEVRNRCRQMLRNQTPKEGF